MGGEAGYFVRSRLEGTMACETKGSFIFLSLLT
jgi:hypothetical protein